MCSWTMILRDLMWLPLNIASKTKSRLLGRLFTLLVIYLLSILRSGTFQGEYYQHGSSTPAIRSMLVKVSKYDFGQTA